MNKHTVTFMVNDDIDQMTFEEQLAFAIREGDMCAQDWLVDTVIDMERAPAVAARAEGAPTHVLELVQGQISDHMDLNALYCLINDEEGRQRLVSFLGPQLSRLNDQLMYEHNTQVLALAMGLEALLQLLGAEGHEAVTNER